MKIGIEISLLDSIEINEFCKQIVNAFTSESEEYVFIFNGKNYKYDLKKVNTLLQSGSSDFTFFLSSKNGPDGIVFATPSTKFIRKAASITVDYLFFKQKLKIIEKLFMDFSNIFISCFIFDHQFYAKQNARYESDLSQFKKEELKNVKFIKDKYGQRIIDNERNLGKGFYLNSSFLTTAPLMYFSENNKLFTFEDLTSYTNGARIEFLKDNIIKVQLFAEINDTEKPENIEKLKKFKTHFQFEEIVKKDEN